MSQDNPDDDGLVRKEIYPCPCGQTPVALMCEVDSNRKRGHVFGDCCGEWQVEFSNNYTQDKEKMGERARKAWNAAQRPD